MVRVIFSFCALISYWGNAEVSSIPVTPVPGWVTPIGLKDVNEPKNKESFNYLLLDEQTNLVGENKHLYFHVIVELNNQQAVAELSQIEIPYFPSFELIELHTLQIVRDGEVIELAEQSEIKTFQDESELDNKIYQERWNALIVLNDVRAGDVIEYSFSTIGTNPVFGKKRFGYSSLNWRLPVSNSFFRLITREGNYIQFNVAGKPNQMVKSSKAGIDEYLFTQSNIPATRAEDMTPNWHSQFAFLEYTEHQSWEEVNQWALPLYNDFDSMSAEFKELVNGLKRQSTLESAVQVSQWIQDNIRYFGVEIGESSHLPSSPQETYNRRFGDCKDKTVLLIAGLNALGIEAQPALVSTVETKSVFDRLPSPGVFNHVITTFTIEGQRYWVDPTVSNQRGGINDMSFPDYKAALIVQDSTTDLAEISPQNPSQIFAKVQTEDNFYLGGANVASDLNVVTRYSGWKAEYFRSDSQNANTDLMTQNYVDYYTRYFEGLSATSDISIQDDSEQNTIKINQNYSIEDVFYNDSTDVVMLYATSFFDNLTLPVVKQRQTPFQLIPIYVNHVTNIRLKEQQKVAWSDSQEPVDINTDWFTYKRHVVNDEQGIAINHKFSPKTMTVSAEDFPEFYQAFKKMEDRLYFRLRLSSSLEQREKRVKNLLKGILRKEK